MIEKLDENVRDYEIELQNLSYSEIEEKENDSFTINGNHLNELSGLINEKIKIADTFTHYIIEKCNPIHINILRKFVEEYEKKVEQIKEGNFDIDDIENLKMLTVSINLLFGIDVSYYTILYKIYSESKISDICNYFYKNINYELNYDNFCTVIRGKGLNK